MKRKTTIIVLLLSIQLFSQKKIVKIIDSITKKGVPYCTIQLKNSNKGLYSDENGYFINSFKKNDTIIISNIGYNVLEITFKSLKNDIYLVKKVESLGLISISSKKKKFQEVYLGYSKMSRNLSTHVSLGDEIVTLIKPKKIDQNIAYIKEVKIPFTINRELLGEKTLSFKLNFYANIGDKPDYQINYKPILFRVTKYDKKNYTINIKSEDIQFDKNGVFVGVEFIGEENRSEYYLNELKNPKYGVCFLNFTEKLNKQYTYKKNKFKEKDWKSLLNQRGYLFYSKKSNYNLAIGIVLDILKK
jgi:hypothetical protein